MRTDQVRLRYRARSALPPRTTTYPQPQRGSTLLPGNDTGLTFSLDCCYCIRGLFCFLVAALTFVLHFATTYPVLIRFLVLPQRLLAYTLTRLVAARTTAPRLMPFI